MDKMDNILYSLLPVVIIILISWAFSFLGSKKRRQGDDLEPEPQTSPRDQFFDFLSDQAEEEEGGAARRDMTGGRPGAHAEPDVWAPDVPAGGPTVTPKPIKPKWWGA